MQGGAIDYLLKPVVSEELEELLVKMRTSIDEERRKGITDFQLEQQINQSNDENYGFELSLTGLAEKYYINAAYLSDIFHKQTGKTYSQYLLDVRMTRAKLFLHLVQERFGGQPC